MSITEKTAVDQLTLFTLEKPMLSSFVPVGRPNMGDKADFLAHVDRMWDTRNLTNRGPLVQQFEKEVAAYLGVKHFVAMCNGTIALEIAASALGLTGEVIVPSFTFVATAHCLKWQGITPVFCDVDPKTHLLDPKKVRELITPRTTGIIGVHLWGSVCEVEELEKIAKEHNLKLMFDAAHAMGSARHGRMVGNFGDCEVLSFHATKFFNTFEGGGIATNDDKLVAEIRTAQNFGFVGYDNAICVGTNGKMTEVCAALGLVNIKCVSSFIEVNKRNYDEYKAAINSVPGFTVFEYDVSNGNAVNYQYIVLEVDSDKAGLTRDEFVAILTAENVSARRYFFPGAHRMMPYRTEMPEVHDRLPETNRLCSRVICLPTGTSISVEQIRAVGKLLHFCVAHAAEIKEKLTKLPFPLPISPDQIPKKH